MMKNKSYLYLSALLFLSFFAAFLLNSTNASAQRILPDARAVTDCYNTKLKASGKYVNCLLRAERKANRDGVEVTQDDVAHCHKNFEERYSKAEAKAAEKAVECPSHGGLTPYQQTVQGATSTINLSNDVKKLTVMIDQEDLEFLTSESLTLNIALKVNDTYNVVWRSVSDYSMINEFQWSPIYHVFGATSFQPSTKVLIATNVVDIELDQDVFLAPNNILEIPFDGTTPNGITFINDSGDIIFPAIAQQLTVDGSSQAFTPIYVGDPLLSGELEPIIPTQEVMLWFDEETETGTIFNSTESISITVDLANKSSATIVFSDRRWSSQQ